MKLNRCVSSRIFTFHDSRFTTPHPAPTVSISAHSCPACGEEIHPNARACPHCGACEKSGWRADAAHDGLDLPDAEEDFDYDTFVEQEFGDQNRRLKPYGLSPFWWITGIILLLAFALLTLRAFL